MIKIDIDAMYAYINTTKTRNMDHDVLSENALRARNELATLNSGEDDDRIDDLLTLVEILEDYCDEVERIPDWFNPNTLTLTGFSFILMPFFILFLNYGTGMSDQTPRIPVWFNVMMGICYFLYRIFDEMDGK